jgi:4-hydroxyphenylpyruvate dioxygenase
MAPSAISPHQSTTNLASSNEIHSYRGYDHVQWYVGNAKQAASYYISRMAFERVAYRGLETGSQATASHVLRNGNVTFVLTSPLRSLNQLSKIKPEEQDLLREIHAHLEKHGDAVKDVAFTVDSVSAVFDAAVANGARVVSRPKVLKDETGWVKVATIQTYGETTHTLIERSSYHGCFLPGFRVEQGANDPLSKLLPQIGLDVIDHCVGNQDWNEMEAICD